MIGKRLFLVITGRNRVAAAFLKWKHRKFEHIRKGTLKSQLDPGLGWTLISGPTRFVILVQSEQSLRLIYFSLPAIEGNKYADKFDEMDYWSFFTRGCYIEHVYVCEVIHKFVDLCDEIEYYKFFQAYDTTHIWNVVKV